MPFGSDAHTWRPGPPCPVLFFPNVVLLFGLQLQEFAMLLSVSALLWLQSPAWFPPSPQYAPGAYLGRAHRGPSPRVGGRMMRLASLVSSASPWLDMSIQALPAG